MGRNLAKRFKKLILQDPIVSAAPMQTRFEKRPFCKTILSPEGFQLHSIQKVALALLLIPAAVVFIASLISANWTLLAITGFLLLMVALISWIIKLRAQMSWEATWHEDMVQVADGRYGKIESWTEPLTAFSGLQCDFALLQRGGSSTPNQKIHGLLLAHPDPFKSVLLHAGFEPIDDHTVAYYEQALDKPLID